MRRMSFLGVLAALALPGCCALALVAAGCGHGGGHGDKAEPPKLEPASVRVEVVEPGGERSGEDVVGTVESERTAVIEAKVAGTVADVRVRPGERVAAGEVMVLLDAPEVAARRDQALAQYNRAESEFQKFQQLIQSKAISQIDFDRVEGEFRRATAALEEAETMVDYTKVSAPFDGIVSRRMADPGSQAAPGRGLLVLEDDSRLQFAAEVPEGLVDTLEIGQPLEVAINVLGAPLTAEVVEISPSANPASRTFLVKAKLPPAEGLRSGQFGRTRIPLAQSAVLTVPSSAVVRRGQLEMLFIEREGRAAMRLVRSGRVFGERVEIVSGLEPGERVVVEGAGGLRDGQPLDVLP